MMIEKAATVPIASWLQHEQFKVDILKYLKKREAVTELLSRTLPAAAGRRFNTGILNELTRHLHDFSVKDTGPVLFRSK